MLLLTILGPTSVSRRKRDSPSQADDFLVRAPSLSLPKGGGAIRGIEEKFAANLVTGTGSMTIPISTWPGRSGFGPTGCRLLHLCWTALEPA